MVSQHHPIGAYPRIRRGNFEALARPLAQEGLSPHTRGKRPSIGQRVRRWGPIPAYAGETRARRGPCFGAGAYPRIRGGNSWRGPTKRGLWGLSPHTRGKQPVSWWADYVAGPIPAYAGETFSGTSGVSHERAYPRIRGGNLPVQAKRKSAQGLSPHTRGKHTSAVLTDYKDGPIPAYAGETPRFTSNSKNERAYPRIRGGNSVDRASRTSEKGLSPHTRGKLFKIARDFKGAGPIPAYAGETVVLIHSFLMLRAYPRIRGGNRGWKWRLWGLVGLSPHTRGKRCGQDSRGRL